MSTPYKGSISYTELISLDDKVQLYRNVFGEAPWNEGYICPSTGQSYPRETIATLIRERDPRSVVASE